MSCKVAKPTTEIFVDFEIVTKNRLKHHEYIKNTPFMYEYMYFMYIFRAFQTVLPQNQRKFPVWVIVNVLCFFLSYSNGIKICITFRKIVTSIEC